MLQLLELLLLLLLLLPADATTNTAASNSSSGIAGIVAIIIAAVAVVGGNAAVVIYVAGYPKEVGAAIAAAFPAGPGDGTGVSALLVVDTVLAVAPFAVTGDGGAGITVMFVVASEFPDSARNYL